MTAEYWQVDVIVEGALEESTEPTTKTELDAIVERVRAESAEYPEQSTAVYVIYHGHAVDVDDCACVQYLTDHHPAYTFGREDDQ